MSSKTPTVKKEPVKKEPVKKEPVKKEPVKKEPVQKPVRTAEEEAAIRQWIHEHWETTDELGNTPLHRAVLRGDVLYATGLIAQGIDAVNHRTKTPLHLAVQKLERNGMVQMLVLNGADINATTEKGRTPLFYSHTDHIPYLVKNGASLDTVDSEGLTPFLYAVQKRDALRALRLIEMKEPPRRDRERAFAIAKHNGDTYMTGLLEFRLL